MIIVNVIKRMREYLVRLLVLWCAYLRKQRSVRAMERLDDHLLRDIGFCREHNEIVPLHRVQNGDLVRNHQRKVRLRCSFLVRRRQRRRRR